MEYSKELEKRNAELRRLDQLKNEFLATTTHELRLLYLLLRCCSLVYSTPLNAILGTTSLLYDTLRDEEQRSNLKTIEQAATTQLHHVNDLLDTSKLQGKTVISLFLITDKLFCSWQASDCGSALQLA